MLLSRLLPLLLRSLRTCILQLFDATLIHLQFTTVCLGLCKWLAYCTSSSSRDLSRLAHNALRIRSNSLLPFVLALFLFLQLRVLVVLDFGLARFGILVAYIVNLSALPYACELPSGFA